MAAYDRVEETEDILEGCGDIICIDVNNEACDGIMEYDSQSGTWICDQCDLELGADDILEEVMEQVSELYMPWGNT